MATHSSSYPLHLSGESPRTEEPGRLQSVGLQRVRHDRVTDHTYVDCSPQGSSGHGILQARTLEWVAISFSRIVQMNRIKFYFIHFILKKCFGHAERHVGS